LASLDINKETKLFLKPCRTKLELKAWIKHFLGLALPDCTVSRYADTNPLNVIWEVYNICVNRKNPDNIQELLFVAGRGSGKTLGMAIAEMMIALHDQRDVVHVGAILSQAKRCYEYQQKFLLGPKIRPIVDPPDKPIDQRILEKTNMERSYFNVAGQKVTIEVIPCTLKACLTIDNDLIFSDNSIVKAGDVKQGDYLKTPLGAATVLNNTILIQACMMVELEDGRVIKGTRDHRVWTSRGWIKLCELCESDEIL
jgi:hypothetical protein